MQLDSELKQLSQGSEEYKVGSSEGWLGPVTSPNGLSGQLKKIERKLKYLGCKLKQPLQPTDCLCRRKSAGKVLKIILMHGMCHSLQIIHDQILQEYRKIKKVSH